MPLNLFFLSVRVIKINVVVRNWLVVVVAAGKQQGLIKEGNIK